MTRNVVIFFLALIPIGIKDGMFWWQENKSEKRDRKTCFKLCLFSTLSCFLIQQSFLPQFIEFVQNKNRSPSKSRPKMMLHSIVSWNFISQLETHCCSSYGSNEQHIPFLLWCQSWKSFCCWMITIVYHTCLSQQDIDLWRDDSTQITLFVIEGRDMKKSATPTPTTLCSSTLFPNLVQSIQCFSCNFRNILERHSSFIHFWFPFIPLTLWISTTASRFSSLSQGTRIFLA